MAIRNLRPDAPCTIHDYRICEGTDPAYSLPGGPYGSVVIPGGGMARFPLRFAPGPGFCLEPGNTGCIEFEFEPSVDGHRSISLSCAGLAPPALLVPTALDFGAAGPGCSPRSRDFQVINTASRSLHFRAIGFGEGTSGEFTIVGASTPGQLIPSGLSRTFTVAYRPEDLGVDVGQVWIELDEEPEPLVVSLVGQGVESTPPCDGSE